MNNYLMSETDVLREKVNSEDFDSINRSTSKSEEDYRTKYTLFIFQLLEYSFCLGIISKEKINNITKDIQTALTELTGSNPRITNNYLYMASLYLRTMSNWEALSSVIIIDNLPQAFELFMSAGLWFSNQLKEISKSFRLLNEDVSELRNKQILQEYKHFLETVEKVSKNSVALINEICYISNYNLLVHMDSSLNILENLRNFSDCFAKEVHIMRKLNAGTFFHKKKTEISKVSEKTDVESLILEQEKKAKESLEKLEQEYRSNLKKIEELSKMQTDRLNQLDMEVRQAHPEFTDEQVEAEADRLAEKDEILTTPVDDELSLERKYFADKKSIINNKEKQIQELINNEEVKKESFDDEFIYENDSLGIFIKEFGYYQLFQNGDVDTYPSDLVLRTREINKIPLSDFIKAVIPHINLTENEEKYLLSCK